MKEIFDEDYENQIKRKLTVRLIVFLLLTAMLAALYIASYGVPGKLWVTLAVGILSVLLLGVLYIYFVSPFTSVKRMMREVKNGLYSADEAVFQGEKPEKQYVNGVMCSRLSFEAVDDTGRTYERELLFPGFEKLEIGERYKIKTYQQMIVAYESWKEAEA